MYLCMSGVFEVVSYVFFFILKNACIEIGPNTATEGQARARPIQARAQGLRNTGACS